MGCFLGCFDSSKDAKTPQLSSNHYPNHHEYTIVPVYPTVIANQDTLKKPIDVIVSQRWVKQEEEEKLSLTRKDKPEKPVQLSSGTRKKVTFDSNVKEYDIVSFDDPRRITHESQKGCEIEVVVQYRIKPIKTSSKSQGSTVSGLGFPQNHIYKNSGDSDDEDEGLGCEVSDLDDDKIEEPIQLSSGTRKKVTFDSNVKEYEHVSFDDPRRVTQESQKGCVKEVVEYSIKPIKSSSKSESSTLSSSRLIPSNHMCNCRESDEEVGLDCQASGLEEDEDHDEDKGEEEGGYYDEYSDDDYHIKQVQEVSARPCASLQSRTRSFPTCSVDDGYNDQVMDDGSQENGTTPVVFIRDAQDRDDYIHSVLNPVENSTQWKTVKVKGTPPLIEEQENFRRDIGFQLSSTKFNFDEPKNNLEVDATMSTWLASSPKTSPSKDTPFSAGPILSGESVLSNGSKSVRTREERPILGALTAEELKHFSATSSSRSPNRSPDERPVVGNVGVQWDNRTPVDESGSISSFKVIPNTTSKYRKILQDKRVNWHSTTFETRLERAENRGAAEQCHSSAMLTEC